MKLQKLFSAVVAASLLLVGLATFQPVLTPNASAAVSSFCTKKYPKDANLASACDKGYKSSEKTSIDSACKGYKNDVAPACYAGFHAKPDPKKPISDDAESYCEKTFDNNGQEDQKKACDKGYGAGKSNKDSDEACKGLRGNNKKACANGYSQGKKKAPKKGSSASDANLNCGGSGSGVCDTGLPTPDAGSDKVKTLLSIAITILGAISVLVIVLSGLRMVTAQGDSQQIAKARNGILYSVIGLLIAIVAQSIVYFALGKV